MRVVHIWAARLNKRKWWGRYLCATDVLLVHNSGNTYSVATCPECRLLALGYGYNPDLIGEPVDDSEHIS